MLNTNPKNHIMKDKKKHPKKQLEKYSNIFMQLSLVLVLFVVYQIIEFESVQKNMAINLPENIDQYVYIPDDEPIQFKKEIKKTIRFHENENGLNILFEINFIFVLIILLL